MPADMPADRRAEDATAHHWIDLAGHDRRWWALCLRHSPL